VWDFLQKKKFARPKICKTKFARPKSCKIKIAPGVCTIGKRWYICVMAGYK